MILSNGAHRSVSSNSLMSTSETAIPPHIVLVDDDDLFRESLGLNLVDEGYEVSSFAGGAPALEHFSAGGHADVVLLDWRMPGMNGLQGLRSLGRPGDRHPRVFLTALRDASD